MDWAPCLDREKRYKFQQYDRLIKLKRKKQKSFNPTKVLFGQKKFVAFDDDMVLQGPEEIQITDDLMGTM